MRLKEPHTLLSQIYRCFILVCGILELLSHLTFIYFNWGEIDKVLKAFPVAILFFIAVLQYIICMIYENEWRDVVNHIENVLKYHQVCFNEKSYEKTWLSKFFEKKNIEFKLLCIVFLSAMSWWITAFVYGTLPFDAAWFPFDQNKHFIFVFLFQFFVNCTINYNMTIMRILTYKVCFKIIDLLRMLQHSLENIDDKNKANDINMMNYSVKIKRCSNFHDKILRYSAIISENVTLTRT